MRHSFFLLSLILITVAPLAAGPPPPPTDIVINEVNYRQGANQDWVEFLNTGSGTIDISSWWVCFRFNYLQLNGVGQVLLDGTDLNLSPGEYAVVQLSLDVNSTSSDFGLYSVNDFPDPADMVDFLQWGTSVDVGRSDVAFAKGIWSRSSPTIYDFVATAPGSETVQYLGTNSGGGLLTLSSDFVNDPATRNAMNTPVELMSFSIE